MTEEDFLRGLMLPFQGHLRQPEPPRTQPIPTLSWTSSNQELIIQMSEARNGVMLLKDLDLQVPMVGARETFCKLYQEPELVTEHINKLNPPRGLYKYKAFMDKTIDQKIMLDLSPSQIDQIHEKRLVLGHGFNQVVDFYQVLQQTVVPRLVSLVSSVICGDGFNSNGYSASRSVVEIHNGMNHKLRLVDYFPVHRTSQRCGEHRDYSTFTLIFQDKKQGGLQVLIDNKWISISENCEFVLIFGWSTYLLSNGRIVALTKN